MVQASKVIYKSSSIVYNPNHNLMVYGFNILIFLKMNGMSPKQKRFYYVFTLKDSQKHIIKLINQLISVITVAHIAAIGWYFIGIQEIVNNYPTNWLDKLGISSQLYYEKYIYSIYWSITTMTTVGYGDIAATNYIEALFIAINMILFSCVFAYSINNIGFILQEIEKSSKQLNDNITTIQRYLNRKNVNVSLKSRVRHYLSFLAQEQKDRDKEQEDQIISILSNKLRDEITIEINSRILSNYHIFSSNFSQTTLKKLVFRMKEVLVSPNEIIFSDEQYDDLSIYFIQNGIIEIYQQSAIKQGQVTVIQTLSDNQLFGEISFFSGLSRKASARSVNLSTLYKISREDFIDVLNENDEDYQRFKMMQEQLIFQNELSILYTECYTCKQSGHLAKSCPRTHQQFDKQFTILKNSISFFQEREDKERCQIRVKQKACTQIQKNSDLSKMLKENIQNFNSEVYLMFNSEENVNGSEYTSSEDQEQEEEDEEDSQSESQYAADNKSQEGSTVSNKKNSFLIKKSNKNQKKDIALKHNIINNHIESDQNCGQEIQITNKPGGNQQLERQDSPKSQMINLSQNKLKSVEISEGQSNHLNSESSNKINYSNNNISGECKQTLKQDSESLNTNFTEIQQKQIQEELEQINQTNRKSQKYLSQKKNSNNNLQYMYNISRVSKKLFEDNDIQATDNQLQQNSSERFSQVMSQQFQSSYNNSKKMNTQNSSRTINFESNDIRCSIDQILLQGMIANSILQAHRQSQITSKKGSVHSNIFQDILEKNYNQKSKNENMKDVENEGGKKKKQSSIKLIKDQKEEKSIKNLSNLNCVQGSSSSGQINSNNTNQNSRSFSNAATKNQQVEILQQKTDELQLDRFSRLIQSGNLPLLLQYTSGLSFKDINTINNNQSMEFFDKMFNFKKFFPHNNFDKVINKLKSIQSEQKRLKKQKLTQKQRRLNILLADQNKASTFNLHSGQIKIIPQDFNIDVYKPTYLSYGVGMRKGINFPKNRYNID
ncbi:cation channel family protein (macronuclear) [Tetrahymena thermophila SB210]|uniref:Cation channel family protein n=1 Tax=Tetrahymena thermophila (strain SB210) TaxID=312017 RepID=W7XGG6_TETTS|nr:cation channel family protein [Tetrahymena thermophila SB210]EWS76068.1 cation channel family protein [Tetrahymena thermophila SB210]|eukprot:XP_012651375.1 cation channel family protein [Tetrahymena thermophila SB210]